MNFSTIYSLSGFSQTTHTTLSKKLASAIKDYRDEYLTGLTDEERAQIKKEIEAYLKSLPKGSKLDPAELNSMIAQLLKHYGYKGNIDEMSDVLLTDVRTDLVKEAATSEEASIAFKKLNESQVAFHFNTSNQSALPDEEEELITKVITNPDGSKSLVIMKKDVILSTIKLEDIDPLPLDSSLEKEVNQSDLESDSLSHTDNTVA